MTPSQRWISARARALEPVAVSATTGLEESLRAAGRDVLALYGSPYWLPPAHVRDAARAAVDDNTGAPARGLPALREAMAAQLWREKGVRADAERELLVTNAANHGLLVLLGVVLEPGDEVLTYAPHYYYQGLVALAGGVPVYAPLSQSSGWAWDADALRAAVTPRTKVVIVNTPANPTGYVASADDLAAIVALAEEHDLLIVSDEAYDHTVYDGARHISIGSLPGAERRTVTVISATKSYVLRHWRVGVLAGPAQLIDACANVLEWSQFKCGHVAQHALLAALTGPQDWLADIGTRFQANRDLAVARLSGLRFAVPRGGPFLFLGVEEDAEATWSRLLHDHGVPTDPGRAFGSSNHLRLPFGGEPDVVSEAARRVRAALAG